MASSYQNRAGDMVSDYANIRTVPAMLSTLYIIAGLFQFGAIPPLEVLWLDYTLTTQHSLIISLGAYVAAFASSETKQFENYMTWEKVAIALGPVLILGNEYVSEINSLLLDIGDPLGMQLAFIATLVSWGVAVQ
jgi:hypothetical protein